MAPVWTLVAALATVVVAASGQALPSVGTATATGGSLRGGGRRLQEGMCNFIGCPAGYTPIPDAMNVECNDDPCEPSQCCEAFCSYHPCPANYIPITNAATAMCPVTGCTDDLCCMDGNVMDMEETPTDTTTLTSTMTGATDDC